MTGPRPSVAVQTENIANTIVAKLIGLTMFYVSGYFDLLEMRKSEPATVPLCLFSGLAIIGAALTCTDPIVNLLTKLAGIVMPLLPARWRGRDS